MNNVILILITFAMASCSLCQSKPDVIYEDKIVTIYPMLLLPVEVIDSKTSIYTPRSDYMTFTFVAGDVSSFKLTPTTYGYQTFKHGGVLVDAVLVDSMHFAEMKMAFKILMENHIYTKKFLKMYKEQYKKIEEESDLQ